jgi:AraC-like DNA-binding protein
MVTIEENLLKLELERTWALLHATSKSPKKRIAFYDQLPPPPWAKDGTPGWMKEEHTGYERKEIQSSHDRIMTAALKKGFVSYSHFPIFAIRLRQLRHYMDNQKPTSFRQLWIDKRDSLGYYTFSALIVIGVLGILLALVSLAVSIAQAVASFRALGPGPPTVPST